MDVMKHSFHPQLGRGVNVHFVAILFEGTGNSIRRQTWLSDICPSCRSLTGSEYNRLGMVGVCWSTQTTFFISSKLGSVGTKSKKGGL